MKLLTLQDAWESFLEQPSAARFIALREIVVGEDDYRPCPAVLAELCKLLREERYERLQDHTASLMPAWALCPRIHFLAGCAAEALGDWEEVELCRFLTASCLEGIRSTGDGTRPRPWLVTYPSDAQDCLASLGECIAGVQSVEGDDGLLDIVTAKSGKTYWFDAAEMVAGGDSLLLRTGTGISISAIP